MTDSSVGETAPLDTTWAFALAEQKRTALTAQDRCDRCSAAALGVVILLSGEGELLFCGHHLDQHKSALEGVAVWTANMVDRRDTDA